MVIPASRAETQKYDWNVQGIFKILESLIFTEAVLLRRNETLNYLELLEMNY